MRVSWLPLALAAASLACSKGLPATRSESPKPASATVSPAPRASFRPPSDGRLTTQHLDRYLTVAGRLSSVSPKQRADALDPASAESRVFSETGVSAEEYFWIKERILEAETATLVAKRNADVLAMLEKTLADLRDRREKAPDEGSKKLLSEQIANFEAEAARTRRESKEREPESIRSNQKLVDSHRTRLNALQRELDREVAVSGRSPTGTPPAAPKKP